MSKGRRKTTLPMGLPRTVAGRVEFVDRMLGGHPIVDHEGRPTGELTAPMITKEQARGMLAVGGLFAPTLVGFPDCTVTPPCNKQGCWYCRRRTGAEW